jgi:hypothetical protein
MSANVRAWAMNAAGALLIVVLSALSGYTTQHGLSFFVEWWMAVPLAVAVQFVIVMSTIHFARSYAAANAWRPLTALATLMLCTFVSVFFSYFTFREKADAAASRQGHYAAMVTQVERFGAAVQSIKSSEIARLRKEIATARANMEAAFGGRLPNGDVIPHGFGPAARFFKQRVEDEEKALHQIEKPGEAEILAAETRAYLMRTGPKGLTEEGAYTQLRDLIAQAAKAADALTLSAGKPAIAAPVIPSREDYLRHTPSLNILAEISWLSLLLASLVDFLTVVLAYWMERAPFGLVHRRDRHRLIEQLLTFTSWSVNANDQLEIRLTPTEEERVRGIFDAERLFAATAFMNTGYLRRVNVIAAEFTPRLYALLNDYFAAGTSEERTRS